MHDAIDPTRITAWSHEGLVEDWLPDRLSALKHVLANATKSPDNQTIVAAVQFIFEASGVSLSPLQFSRLLDLYPYLKATVADHGWGGAEVRVAVLDVVAHAILGTRWPRGADECDVRLFAQRLRFAATGATRLLS